MTVENALSRYFRFVSKGAKDISMGNPDVGAVGGYDRLKQHLHVNAALQLMEEEKIDYLTARAKVTALVEDWLTYAAG